MPSDAAMRAAKAIRASLNGDYFYADYDAEIAETIDREMGRCDACDGDGCDICQPQRIESDGGRNAD